MKDFPYQEHILNMQEHDEVVIWIKDKAFIVRPATDNEIERVNKGFFCTD